MHASLGNLTLVASHPARRTHALGQRVARDLEFGPLQREVSAADNNHQIHRRNDEYDRNQRVDHREGERHQKQPDEEQQAGLRVDLVDAAEDSIAHGGKGIRGR